MRVELSGETERVECGEANEGSVCKREREIRSKVKNKVRWEKFLRSVAAMRCGD